MVQSTTLKARAFYQFWPRWTSAIEKSERTRESDIGDMMVETKKVKVSQSTTFKAEMTK